MPALHFAALGALLFVFEGWRATNRLIEEARDVIVITSADIEAIRADFLRQTGLVPTAVDMKALMSERIDEEVLYHEALFRGLHRGDRSVRQRLIQKMRFLSEETERTRDELYRDALALGLDRDDIVIRRMLIQKMRLLAKLPASNETTTESDIRAFFELHAEDYRQPPRVSIHHLFLSRDRRGADLKPAARDLHDRLTAEGITPEHAVAWGDPFPLGHVFRSSSPRQLEKIFGGDFAAAVFTLEPLAWSLPVVSAYGLHLVWVSEKLPSKLPSLNSVRGQVERRYQTKLRDERLKEIIKELRDSYDVRVESAANEAT